MSQVAARQRATVRAIAPGISHFIQVSRATFMAAIDDPAGDFFNDRIYWHAVLRIYGAQYTVTGMSD
jgi:hypothetical protein